MQCHTGSPTLFGTVHTYARYALASTMVNIGLNSRASAIVHTECSAGECYGTLQVAFFTARCTMRGIEIACRLSHSVCLSIPDRLYVCRLMLANQEQ